MITPMLIQFMSQGPQHLQNTGTRTDLKFPAAFENARKSYLRTLYGFQPAQGNYYGYVRYAKAEGSVVTVEIYFHSGRPPIGAFEVPLYAFKKDGKVIKKSADAEEFVGYEVMVTVAGRYKFNGILLSNVTCIDMDNDCEPVRIVLAQPKTVQK